ncbi:methyltransferase [Vibrio sp. 10N.261.55.A7]|uniref:methyltransferase n=1 Tax=Vibrio sp. 10N.261.55.A7 TaxID=1880851 RepID=UPI000C828705|nr:methyltransferase [Vibrio sp. 10N.261.55.A7]PMJ93434.1 SAM-dependent methyltransferase [Vibrio sp. 10N.261.55.A7]
MNTTFESLDKSLIAHSIFWRFEPFHSSLESEFPWERTHPALTSWLNSLSPDEIETFKSDPTLLIEPLSLFIPDLIDVMDLISLPESAPIANEMDRKLSVGIPGRKLEQICSMGEASISLHKGSEWLEWCSGKGYLGRILAERTQQKVTSLEYQSELCESGQESANKLNLPMHFIQGDALAPQRMPFMNSNQHAVALHACGDLHSSLLYKVTQESLPAVTISPCCYHLISSEKYQAMSSEGQASKLSLVKRELRIPLQETVTGGERVKRHRFLEMCYRLGFDILLREENISTEYLPIPSVKKSQLSKGFEFFCHWASSVKGIELSDVDFDHYLEKGTNRFWVMERLSLVQQLFRRPLELWLVLDKALYLDQHGYTVSLSQFCSRQVTPRNILLHAYRN